MAFKSYPARDPFEDELLERQLLQSLSPITPRPEFVNRLRYRLTNEPVIVLERKNEAAALVVAALGLFFGALLVWIGLGLRAVLGRAQR